MNSVQSSNIQNLAMSMNWHIMGKEKLPVDPFTQENTPFSIPSDLPATRHRIQKLEERMLHIPFV